jgi:hypothetical protein
MKKQILRFLKDDSGMVSVDWIVMSAVVLGLGLAAVNAAQSGIMALSQGMLDDSTSTLRMTISE